jgi:hypothetical protein
MSPKGLERKVGRYVAASAVVLASCLAVVGVRSTPVAAATAPPYTNSEYMYSTDATTMYNDGCLYGTNNVSGLHILDWGRPAYNSSTDQFGAYDYSSDWVSNTNIRTASDWWAVGWEACSTNGTLELALGTNDSNDLGTCNGCLYKLPASHSLPGGGSNTGQYVAGFYWGSSVNIFENSLITNNYRQDGVGAFDAEPGFDPNYASDTGAFTTGYNYESSWAFYDFGTADPGYWTEAQLYDVSFGQGDEQSIPEIYYSYNTAQTEEWVQGGGPYTGLDAWAKANGHPFAIDGVTDDYASACPLTPSTDWSNVLSAIQTHSNVYNQSYIDWLTNYAC